MYPAAAVLCMAAAGYLFGILCFYFVCLVVCLVEQFSPPAIECSPSFQGSTFMAGYAVELHNIVKRFPGPTGEDVTAVNNVTMQIRDGEFFSMLGPSGCGKTTSLRMIAGFELPTSGEVLIHGKPMGQTPPFQRPVNTVFQSYALFPHMTIGENVAFGLQMKSVAKSEIGPRVTQALQMVRLPGYERRRRKQMMVSQ